MMVKKISDQIKKIFALFSSAKNKFSYTPIYRVIDIIKTENESYIVTVQLINKDFCFNMKPEEILADDKLTDLFSPRDIRTLTYLGYLGINSPKYKILAKKLSEKNDKFIFAIKERGSKNVILKTADEIMNEQGILNNLSAKDAHEAGYALKNNDEKTSIHLDTEVKSLSNDSNNYFPNYSKTDLTQPVAMMDSLSSISATPKKTKNQ